MSHSWPLVQMERFDACVEFHTLYEYCGCKFEELRHNELHHGIKKICHFVQPHYARIPEECDKYKTHPFSPGRQGTRIYKAIHIDAKAEQHVLLTPNKVEEKEDTRQDRPDTWIWEIAKHELFQNAFREEQIALANFEAKLCNMRVEEEINDLHVDDRAFVYDYRERYCELLSKVSCQDLAICCVCRCRGGPEMKKLPCNHAIHNASHLRRWLSSVPPEEHECPRCKGRIKVLEVPSCPLTAHYNYKEINEAESEKAMSSCCTDESGFEELANVPPSTNLGIRAILGAPESSRNE